MPQPKSPARAARATAAKPTTGAGAKRPAGKRAASPKGDASKPKTAAAAKTASAASRPKAASKAKPASRAKPASKTAAKPASKAKPASTKAAAKPAAGRARAAGASAAAGRSTTRRASANRGAPKLTLAPPPPRSERDTSTDDPFATAVSHIREILTRGVVLTAERLQETLDDAVGRGRLTHTDADELVARLVSIGRSQAEDLRVEMDEIRGELEELFGQSPAGVVNAGLRAGSQLTPDRLVREVDRFRRVAGLGPSFPIIGYDDLTAAQIIERLEDLNSAQLRKVRDRERRKAKRQTVLDAIERALK